MKQVKLVTSTDPLVLETEINEELKRLNLIDGIDIEDIKYSNSGSIYTAMIEYRQVEKKILFEQDVTDTDKLVNLKEE